MGSVTVKPYLFLGHALQALNGHRQRRGGISRHDAVDYSPGLAGFRLTGSGVRNVLAGGTAVDLRPMKFPVDSCVRTRLAQIPAQIMSRQTDTFEIWVERSYVDWLESWLADTAEIVASAHRVAASADCTRRKHH